MYYSGSTGLGFSLKPPAWLRKTVSGIFQKGTEGGVSIPLPGGGTAVATPGGQPASSPFSLPAGMDMGTVAMIGLGIVAVLMLSRRR
jgi:hypothetical protein